MANDGNYIQVHINLGFPNCFQVFYEFIYLSETKLSMADDGNYRQVRI